MEINEDKVRKIIIIYKENNQNIPKCEEHKTISSNKKVFNDIGVGLVSGGFAAAIGAGVTGGLVGGHDSPALIIGSIVTLVICVILGYTFIKMSK